MNDVSTALLACGLLIGGLGFITLALVWLAREQHTRVSYLTKQDERILAEIREHDRKIAALIIDARKHNG